MGIVPFTRDTQSFQVILHPCNCSPLLIFKVRVPLMSDYSVGSCYAVCLEMSFRSSLPELWARSNSSGVLKLLSGFFARNRLQHRNFFGYSRWFLELTSVVSSMVSSMVTSMVSSVATYFTEFQSAISRVSGLGQNVVVKKLFTSKSGSVQPDA